jgi:hypothetical protein
VNRRLQPRVAGDESAAHAAEAPAQVVPLERQPQALIRPLARRETCLKRSLQIERQFIGVPAAEREGAGIAEGLVDTIIPYTSAPRLDSAAESWRDPSSIAHYLALTRGTACQLAPNLMPRHQSADAYRRKAAHWATFRQVQETDTVSAYADPEEVRREAAKPDGVLPPGYGIVPNDKFSMDMALLNEANAEIERAGLERWNDLAAACHNDEFDFELFILEVAGVAGAPEVSVDAHRNISDTQLG